MTSPIGVPATPAAPARTDPGARALAWWQRLKDPAHGDPGTLARLRRARTPLEALGTPAAADLARRLGAATADAPDSRTRDALGLARVLAHVKEHDPMQHPMRAAGWKRFAGGRKESEAGGDRPLLAEGRFRRLLQTSDGEEKVVAFTRLVEFLGGTVKVDDLARDFLRWSHPESGERVRERWAFLYYAADVATPAAPDDDTTTDSPAETTSDAEDDGT